jgi:hypothetical protein
MVAEPDLSGLSTFLTPACLPASRPYFANRIICANIANYALEEVPFHSLFTGCEIFISGQGSSRKD